MYSVRTYTHTHTLHTHNTHIHTHLTYINMHTCTHTGFLGGSGIAWSRLAEVVEILQAALSCMCNGLFSPAGKLIGLWITCTTVLTIITVVKACRRKLSASSVDDKCIIIFTHSFTFNYHPMQCCPQSPSHQDRPHQHKIIYQCCFACCMFTKAAHISLTHQSGNTIQSDPPLPPCYQESCQVRCHWRK